MKVISLPIIHGCGIIYCELIQITFLKTILTIRFIKNL